MTVAEVKNQHEIVVYDKTNQANDTLEEQIFLTGRDLSVYVDVSNGGGTATVTIEDVDPKSNAKFAVGSTIVQAGVGSNNDHYGAHANPSTPFGTRLNIKVVTTGANIDFTVTVVQKSRD